MTKGRKRATISQRLRRVYGEVESLRKAAHYAGWMAANAKGTGDETAAVAAMDGAHHAVIVAVRSLLVGARQQPHRAALTAALRPERGEEA